MIKKKSWWKNKSGQVEHAYFGEAKKTISTTLPISCYNFAKENNLRFSAILTTEIKAVMGEGNYQNREEMKKTIEILSSKFQTLINILNKKLDKKTLDAVWEDLTYLNKTKKKIKDSGY